MSRPAYRRYLPGEGPEAWKPVVKRSLTTGSTAGQWLVVGTHIAVWRTAAGWRLGSGALSEQLLLTRQQLLAQRFATRREALQALALAWWADQA